MPDADRWAGVDFDEFAYTRWNELLRYALLLTGNLADAEDLVQESLARAGARWRRLHHRIDSPERYVRTTMARAHISVWRRLRRERLTASPPERGSADEGHVRIDSDVGLWHALEELPPRQRTVLVLRYYEGLDVAEIAEALGVSAGTVKSQASRALAKLRASYDPARADEGVADGRSRA